MDYTDIQIKLKQHNLAVTFPLLRKKASEIGNWALSEHIEELWATYQQMLQFTMGNCITIEDTNGNRKLLKRRHEQKIDNVAAMMDAFVAYKLNKDAFE